MKPISNCPFCGGECELRREFQFGHHGRDPQDISSVRCDNCRIQMSVSDYPGQVTPDVEDALIDRWNRRAPS